ncbi:MAG TPA: DUF1553 domain-containing protein [Fimbriimonas sp.]|nr:DUF1553 domain-containing protein [Fimbriimonas sp.]
MGTNRRGSWGRVVLPMASICALAVAIWATPSGGSKAFIKKKNKIEFNRDVRPILDKCLSCHGHDPKQVQAGLRLDKRDGAIKVLGDGKQAIVPGHPEKSELITRIYESDKDMLMPPPSSNRVLSPEDKQVLKDWIAEGAEYKQHWAFVKPVRPPLPQVKLKSWPTNDIDRFVLANLEENGLEPSKEADKRTLIRRVSLDLIGLPPTPAEVDAFLADKSPNAYEKVVDRLLASPRYGERMAMDWVDYARYADSNGYQSDWERFQYRWRDWVIDAYNKNMPYDEFTVEQLAGDLLPHPTLDQIIATGFNRNHRINTEGGVIPEEWRTETVIDRVETTSEVWLGLTAGCARCHDHKYDPITQKDFYSLCSYFNNVPETGSGVEQPVNHPPLIKAPYPDQAREMAKFTAEEDKLTASSNARLAMDTPLSNSGGYAPPSPVPAPPGLVARYTLGESPTVDNGKFPAPKVNGPAEADLGVSTGAIKVSDKSFVELGNVGDFDWNQPFSYAFWVNPASDSGSPVARMDSGHDYRGYDLMLAGGRPACHFINTWSENALKVVAKPQLPMNQWSHITVTYDGSAKPTGVHIYINGRLVEQDVEVNSLSGTIRTAVPTRIGRRVDSDIFTGMVDDLSFYDRVLSANDAMKLASAEPGARLLSIPIAKRTGEQKASIVRYWALKHDPQFVKIDDQLKAVVKKKDDLDSKITTVMIMKEMPKPRDCFVLIRGQYDHHGPKVTANVPVAFPPLPKGVPNNRLGLAKWIVSPDNPLTARVTVNRMWERLFGEGIVETSEDFGTRSSFPNNPELLDWLATEMIRQKWDLKAMWKEMVMSSTYRQDSDVTPALEKLDPHNKLLARGPRFRLPAEVIRDQAMLAGGFLTEKIGGPSVRPYQPDGVWDDVSVYGNLHNYKHSVGPDLHRRSLYTIWKRTAAPPDMTLFDVPSRETCIVRRARTDTPLQALVLMNDETYVEAARGIAQRMLEHGGSTPQSRVAYAYDVLLARKPTAKETKILCDGISTRLARYRLHPGAAMNLVKIGDLPRDPKLKTADVAAYTVAASTLLNLDETVTKE